MTDFSNNSPFVSVGPHSDWSSAWTPIARSNQQPTAAFSNGWEVPSATSHAKSSFVLDLNHNVKNLDAFQMPKLASNVPYAMEQQQHQQPLSVGGWSTNWEVPIEQQQQQKQKLIIGGHQQLQSPFHKSPSKGLVPTMSPVKQNIGAAVSRTASAAIEQQQQQQEMALPGKSALYKTELCRSWLEKGTCKYGHKCQFAHGEDELRVIMRHPKYKTEPCKTFTATGNCPYGNRCRFIHPRLDDLAQPQPHHAQHHSSLVDGDNASTSSSPPSGAFELSSLLHMLPSPGSVSSADESEDQLRNTTSSTVSNDQQLSDAEHRLNFFKHLTDE
jgi:hypothetical protein